ncbi:MarR family winged helix-turn-helix transcriptional regulator [Dictyobacter aurantiacus]|uniref:HTH-type transcriptional regulator MgrA n=1 Tax=Dictyobacter aurantiacus TaxID=1936993 RepID=A0A401ZMI7_9CHLR|nr:MarR family transcriptional regulator [Dictyobacter aurantiacus]GCE08079.1 MarR family transcriptional regulator [Dictyobacter aurantiacus]
MGDKNVEERWPFEGMNSDVVGSTLAEEQKVHISDMLCFALYSASRAAIDAYRPLLDELGLTYPQYLVMLVLWERQSCSVKDLGQLLHLDSGTLSPLLKRLEGVGYIARQRRHSDQRVVDIVLTEEGSNLKMLASPIPQKISCQYGIEYGEYRDLLERLKKLTDHLSSPR